MWTLISSTRTLYVHCMQIIDICFLKWSAGYKDITSFLSKAISHLFLQLLFVHCKEHQFIVLCWCLCRHLSTLLGNKFDHGAEAIVPVLFNLIPNCAKVMSTSGTAAIRIIIRVRNSGLREFIVFVCTVSVCVWLCFCIFSTLMFHV